MVGTLKFEMQQWKEALELFGEARFVEVFSFLSIRKLKFYYLYLLNAICFHYSTRTKEYIFSE
jgi:hypothetical protein